MLDEIKEYEQYTIKLTDDNKELDFFNIDNCRLKRPLIKDFSGVTRALTIIARFQMFNANPNHALNLKNDDFESQINHIQEILKAWCGFTTEQKIPYMDHWLETYIRKVFLHDALLNFLPTLKNSKEKKHLQTKLVTLNQLKSEIKRKKPKISVEKMEDIINKINSDLKDAILLDKIDNLFPEIDLTLVSKTEEETKILRIKLEQRKQEMEKRDNEYSFGISNIENQKISLNERMKEIKKERESFDKSCKAAITDIKQRIANLKNEKKDIEKLSKKCLSEVPDIKQKIEEIEVEIEKEEKHLSELKEQKDQNNEENNEKKYKIKEEINKLNEKKKNLSEKKNELKKQMRNLKDKEKEIPLKIKEAFKDNCVSVMAGLEDINVLEEKKEILVALKEKYDSLIDSFEILKSLKDTQNNLNKLKKLKSSDPKLETEREWTELSNKAKELEKEKIEFDATIFDTVTLEQLMAALNYIKQCIEALVNLRNNKAKSYNKKMFSSNFTDPPAFRAITFEKIIANAFHMGALEKYVLACENNPFITIRNNGAIVPTVKKFTEKTVNGLDLIDSDKDLLLRVTAYYLLQKRFTNQAYVVFNQIDLANWLWKKANPDKFHLENYQVFINARPDDNEDKMFTQGTSKSYEPLFSILSIGADKDTNKKGVGVTKIKIHQNWLEKFELVLLDDIEKDSEQQRIYFSDSGSSCYLKVNNNSGERVFKKN